MATRVCHQFDMFKWRRWNPHKRNSQTKKRREKSQPNIFFVVFILHSISFLFVNFLCGEAGHPSKRFFSSTAWPDLRNSKCPNFLTWTGHILIKKIILLHNSSNVRKNKCPIFCVRYSHALSRDPQRNCRENNSWMINVAPFERVNYVFLSDTHFDAIVFWLNVHMGKKENRRNYIPCIERGIERTCVLGMNLHNPE